MTWEALNHVSKVIFDWLVRSSWQSGVLLIVIMLVILALGKWISPRWRYAMWLLIFVHLTMPSQPVSPMSLYSLMNRTTSTPVIEAVNDNGFKTTISYSFSDQVQTIENPAKKAAISEPKKPIDWRIVSLFVWIAGVIISWGWTIISQLRFGHALKRAYHADGRLSAIFDDCIRVSKLGWKPRLLLTDLVNGPGVFGVIGPRVLIPVSIASTLTETQLRFVFMHELAHIQRRDTLIELLATLIRGLHWFNPASHFAMSRLRAERELACDDLVLRQTKAEQQTEYGQTVLFIASQHKPQNIPALAMASGITSLKRRITMISHYQSRKYSNVLPFVLLLAVASCTMTGAQSTQQSESNASDGKGPTTSKSNYSYSHNQIVDDTLLRTNDTTPPSSGKIQPVDATGVQVLKNAENELELKLKTKVPEVRFQEVALDDAIEFFRDTQKLNIYVNWKALERTGIDRKIPISIRMKNVTYAKAINVLLTEASGGNDVLAYTVDQDVLTITTKDEIGLAMETRTYDIRDLIISIPDFETFDTKAPSTQPVSPKRAELVDQLTSLIRDTIGVGTWKEDGGQSGSIRELSGQLIITQTTDNLRQIDALLAKLREQRGLQITVEGRVLSVDISKIAEDKRLKFFNFSLESKDKTSSVVYLDDNEVNEFLDLIKLVPGSSTLSAPRLTIFNGQRAAIEVAKEVNYVASFRRDENKEWHPVLESVKSGITISIQGTISADRKYVTLTLHPRVSKLVKLDTFKFNNTDADAANLIVQLPVVESQELQTSSSLPDSKTLVLSGLSLSTNPGEAGQIMVFLFKPTIIIQREIEQDTFPLLTSQPKK